MVHLHQWIDPAAGHRQGDLGMRAEKQPTAPRLQLSQCRVYPVAPQYKQLRSRGNSSHCAHPPRRVAAKSDDEGAACGAHAVIHLHASKLDQRYAVLRVEAYRRQDKQ